MKKNLVLQVLMLLAWAVLFLAGTDLWHSTSGSGVDFDSIARADFRAFLIAFYGLLIFILLSMGVTIVSLIRKRAE